MSNIIIPYRANLKSACVAETVSNNLSVSFDGFDEYVSAPQSFLNSAAVFSVSFWAKKVLASDDVLIGDRISTFQGAWVNWYTDGKVYFTVRGGSNLFFVTPIAVPFDTNWHHFLCTKNGTDGKIFVDGVLSAITPTDGTVASVLPATCGDDFRVGSVGGNQVFGKSIIDEVALFSTDESANVDCIYNGGTPTDFKASTLNPFSWYRMGDGDVFPSLTDRGRSGEPGIMTNMEIGDIVTDVP